ncbi:GFA family protein [Mesobaculum littorinae]|uniref:GFA family protein n=1 Tax=Mesobaculum littorinae TaxID=2486419 RepID=UPI0013E2C6BB|nr:GFA family protein [Mesobaculum littorinae]
MTRGHCLCGACRYEFDPDALLWQGHCHCDSCRRATGAGFASYAAVRDDAWGWSAGVPRPYESSPGVWRWFCPECGGALAYAAPQAYPGEMHFLAATFDDPARFAPTHHGHAEDRLPWIRLDDGLPWRRGTDRD